MGEGVATLQNEYVLEAIKQVDSIKSTLMTNDREGYAAVKDILFTILDTAKDIQMSTETAQQAFSRNTGKIARYIGKRPVWTYQHKYSLRTTGDCIHYSEITMGHFIKEVTAFEKYADVLLPALKQNTAVAMKARLAKTTKQCTALENAKQEEPSKPVIKQFVADEGADEDEVDEAKAAYKKMVQAKYAIYHRKHTAWLTAETHRKSSLVMCHDSVKTQNAAAIKFNKVVAAVAALPRDQKIVKSFPESLAKEISHYDKIAKAASAQKVDMTDKEQASTLAANKKAVAFSDANDKKAAVRSAENTKVKQVMIGN